MTQSNIRKSILVRFYNLKQPAIYPTEIGLNIFALKTSN